MLLLAIITAAVLRFWQLGEIPAGLYRDEAYNGLDAQAVLEGEHALYFSANNGREPLYIYLTAVAVGLFGPTPAAVRLAAAVIGTLTTWITYQMAKSWLGPKVGLAAAWLWAISLWPIHLSRIGLRAVLLPATLALAAWAFSQAYRRPSTARWLTAGGLYGLTFYTYLAARFTPLLLAAFFLYLLWPGRQLSRHWPQLRRGLPWAALGMAIVLLPLAGLLLQQPALILGRTGQVSILNPEINQGNLIGAFWQHSLQALGLFFVRGDRILRHNVPGRPLFDPLMAVPFLIGLFWCLRHWRRPAAAAALLWTAVMLGPTVLAEDTPHFLRAAGILPAALLFPAIGLIRIADWPRLPGWLSRGLVIIAILFSLSKTLEDYFFTYGQQAETGYWFDNGARELAEQINAEPDGTMILVDDRFRHDWPSVRLLVNPEKSITFYQAVAGLPAEIRLPAALYAWPYENLDQLVTALPAPAMLTGESGSLVQGDLEAEAYPLFVRYTAVQPPDWPFLAEFDNFIQLRLARSVDLVGQEITVDLYWSTEELIEQPLVAFIHVIGPAGLIGQSDTVPAQGHWPSQWWQPGMVIHDRHTISLDESYDSRQHRLLIGLYEMTTVDRLPVQNAAGEEQGDTYMWSP